MDFQDLKIKNLGINKEKFGRIFTFVDYGNVNYWYDKDRRNADDVELSKNEKLIVDVEKMASFTNLFSEEKRFYYGWNPRRTTSWHITIKAEKCGFIKNTKPMQFIKHYLNTEKDVQASLVLNSYEVKQNKDGVYVEIPKSNFDVEISVDAIRLLDKYDTFCLFSGDSDFTYLARYLKKKNKKFIVVASGQVFHTLKDLADLYINAQMIKGSISTVKETTPR